MYELYDPCTVMFFYRCVRPSWIGWERVIANLEYTRNKHIMIDLGTGNNNKMYVLLLVQSSRAANLISPTASVTGQWITNRRCVQPNLAYLAI